MQDWYSFTDKEIIKKTGMRIKKYRILKNYTQEELAKAGGLNRSTIRDVENGKSVTFITLIQILRALELLPNIDLLFPDIDNSPVSSAKIEGKKRVKHISPGK